MKRNWKLLGELAEKNQFLMHALIFTHEKSPEGKKLKACFPEYFEDVSGPVPISILREYAVENLRGEYPADIARVSLEYGGALDAFGIPYKKYNSDIGYDEVNIPLDLLPFRKADSGTFITWRGEEFFVADNQDDGITLVAKPCIDFDH